MSNYHIWSNQWKHLSTFSDELLERTRQTINEMDALNKKVYQENLTAWTEMLKTVERIYGYRSKEYRFLYSHKVPPPPDNQKEFKRFQRKWEQFKGNQERLAKQREYAHDYHQRQNEAVAQLEATGLIEGVDFQRSSAITFLKERQKQAILPE